MKELPVEEGEANTPKGAAGYYLFHCITVPHAAKHERNYFTNCFIRTLLQFAPLRAFALEPIESAKSTQYSPAVGCY